MPYLPEAVTAIRGQTLSPREIVAVVGSSHDGTREYLHSQPDIRVIEQSGVGLATARNVALKVVKYPLVAFCDHDDLWHPTKLEKQVAVITQFSTPATCIVSFEEFSERGPATRTDAQFGHVATLGWTLSALLAHRDVFTAIGPFDPALGFGCDTDWFRTSPTIKYPLRRRGPRPDAQAPPFLQSKSRLKDEPRGDVQDDP